ncbi:hypothetical protein BGZ83_003916 [Gryganskiella cystojenkinii]|nr:hypothetical protein BGZ83_003916 [Gryganskiella cystojenkinii]
MDKEAPTTLAGLVDFPPELLDLVLAHLTKHDLTVCARVNKQWYQCVINRIWHTFEICRIYLPYDDPSYFHGLALLPRGVRAVDPDATTDPPVVYLAKNLGRIRILRIRYIRVMKLLAQAMAELVAQERELRNVEKKNRQNNDGCLIGLSSLQELDIHFMDELPQQPSFFRSVAPPTPAQGLSGSATQPSLTQDQRSAFGFRANPLPNQGSSSPLVLAEMKKVEEVKEKKDEGEPISLIGTVLQILTQSQQSLLKLTIRLDPISTRGQFVDQARLWSALPACLEQLKIFDDETTAFGYGSYMRWEEYQSWMKQISSFDSEQGSPRSKGSEGEGRQGVLFGSPPLPLPSLGQLKVISINSPWTNIPALVSVLTDRRCGSALEELIILSPNIDLYDTSLSQLISMAGRGDDNNGSTTSGGLKTCSIALAVGPLTTSAILNQSKTLENFRIHIDPYRGFPSAAIQKLLCTAPRLKRFDTIPSKHIRGVDPELFMAEDILGSSEDWVCLDLESFKCMVGGIPRPDLKRRTNGRRLKDELHDPSRYSQEQSRSIQRKILYQFSRLTKLRELSLGHDSLGCKDWDPETGYYDEEDDEDLINCAPQTGYQYACLSMRLEDGFDLLKGLKSMRRMHLWRMEHGQGVEEEEWIKKHWPNYGNESRDDFFTVRGHEVAIGEVVHFVQKQKMYWEPAYYDWW